MKNSNLQLSVILIFFAFFLTAFMQFRKKEVKAVAMCSINDTIRIPQNPYYSRASTVELKLTDSEWKRVLSHDVYAFTRHTDTERPFAGKCWNSDDKGTYYCAARGFHLFRSGAKFASSCGWTSFFEQASSESEVYKKNDALDEERIEVLCGRFDRHFGDLLINGPEPTHKRYFMNSIALDFIPDHKK